MIFSVLIFALGVVVGAAAWALGSYDRQRHQLSTSFNGGYLNGFIDGRGTWGGPDKRADSTEQASHWQAEKN